MILNSLFIFNDWCSLYTKNNSQWKILACRINFKKLRPRVTLLKDSKVFKELQQELADVDSVKVESQYPTTFLQKPTKPMPEKILTSKMSQSIEPDSYRVMIRKQPRRLITENLSVKGLIELSQIQKPKSDQNTPEVRFSMI